MSKKIIFVDCCNDCPYRFKGAIASLCNGQYPLRGKFIDNKPIVTPLSQIPEWCPLEGVPF